MVPIIAATYNEKVMRKLALVWGVYPVLSKNSELTDEVIDRAIIASLDRNYIEEGDLVVVTAGLPVGVSGTTNLIKVHVVGEIMLKGTGIGKLSVTGKVCVGNTDDELKDKFEEGDVLVAEYTDRDLVKYIEKASAVVVEEGGLTSHAAIVALHFKKPTIVGAPNATEILKDGQTVTIDAMSGLVYKGEAKVL